MKEEQIAKLRKDLDDFSDRLQKQEKELAGLTNEETGEIIAPGAGDEGGDKTNPATPPVLMEKAEMTMQVDDGARKEI